MINYFWRVCQEIIGGIPKCNAMTILMVRRNSITYWWIVPTKRYFDRGYNWCTHLPFSIPNTFLWQMVNLGNERIDQEMHRPICRDGSDQNPTQNLGKIKLGHLADPSKIKNKTQNWPDEVGKNWPNPSLDISQSISIFWLIGHIQILLHKTNNSNKEKQMG